MERNFRFGGTNGRIDAGHRMENNTGKEIGNRVESNTGKEVRVEGSTDNSKSSYGNGGNPKVVDIDACTQKNSCTQKGVLGDISNFISGISKKTVKCEGRGVVVKRRAFLCQKKLSSTLRKSISNINDPSDQNQNSSIDNNNVEKVNFDKVASLLKEAMNEPLE
ncbi:hypothetical protein ACOSP7_016513 [Xanthoceras sorbifolium]